MGKPVIAILSALAMVIGLIGNIGAAVSASAVGQPSVFASAYGVFAGIGYVGVLVGFVAWLGALRNAWLCRAYGWFVAIIFTFSLGSLLYGLLGPGRMAIMAERRLSWLLTVGPQAAGVPNTTPATPWTVSQLKQSLNYYAGSDHYDLVESDDIMVRTLRRFRWRVLEDGLVSR